jgi:hypothetical protein
MTEFIGWIRCAGDRVLVERVAQEPSFYVVRLCEACVSFGRGQMLRIPLEAFEPCSPRSAVESPVFT